MKAGPYLRLVPLLLITYLDPFILIYIRLRSSLPHLYCCYLCVWLATPPSSPEFSFCPEVPPITPGSVLAVQHFITPTTAAHFHIVNKYSHNTGCYKYIYNIHIMLSIINVYHITYIITYIIHILIYDNYTHKRLCRYTWLCAYCEGQKLILESSTSSF